MKKVVISTWTGTLSLNYGSALQTAALQKVVKEMGYSPVTINNQYNGEKKKIRLKYMRFRRKEYRKTKRKFDAFFRKEVNLSRVCTNNDDAKKIAKKADILMCGSDAVWNFKWICPLFLWDFEELKNKPKIAYEPSIQRGEVEYDMADALKGYVAISGRERKVGEIVSQYTDQPITTVLDPTLLVPGEYWEQQAGERLIEEDYVLCYFISAAEVHRLSVEDVKKKYGNLKVIYINTNCIDKEYGITDYRGEDYPGIVGPREFLSLIKYAAVTCTDSFHGMALSIAFGTEFYVFGREEVWENGADYRFPDLFGRLGINNRFIVKNEQISDLESIDWDMVQKNLSREREKSRKFLQGAFEKAEKTL